MGGGGTTCPFSLCLLSSSSQQQLHRQDKKKITLGKSQAEGKRKKGNKAELCIVLCRDFHKPVVD